MYVKHIMPTRFGLNFRVKFAYLCESSINIIIELYLWKFVENKDLHS